MESDGDLEQHDPTLYAEICGILDQGDLYADNNEFERALGEYNRAFELLPEPKLDWYIGIILQVAIGDVHFHSENFEAARTAFNKAIFEGAETLANPYVRLRIGQVQFELGDMKHAIDNLASAWMLHGDEIFDTEDPKYWALIKPLLRPPLDSPEQE
jgi:tetratricopeptide (TPR) repeat protein